MVAAVNPGGPVIVAGLPRSGSTWTASVLGRAGAVPSVHEPDNEKQWLDAYVAKRGLGRFPVLQPGDASPAYEALWRQALAGGTGSGGTGSGPVRVRLARRLWDGQSVDQRERAVRGQPVLRARLASALTGRSVPPATPAGDVRPAPLVKTVHAPLALDWLATVFPSARVVVILRHPANVLSSWLAMSLPDQDRRLDAYPAVRDRYLQPWDVAGPGDDPLDRAAWQVALLTAALVDATQRHPSWLTVSHEDLCQEPVPRFRELATALDLPFDATTVDFLAASDRPGDGFAIQRRASDLPDAWRDRLETQAKRSLAQQLARFPRLERWADDLR